MENNMDLYILLWCIKYGNIKVIENSIKWNLTIVYRVFNIRVARSSQLFSQQQLHNDRKMCVSCLFSLVAWFGPVRFGFRQTYVALIVHVAQKQLVFNKFYCCSTHKQQLQQQQQQKKRNKWNEKLHTKHFSLRDFQACWKNERTTWGS